VARVLVVGLDPHRVPGPWDPAPVVAGLRRSRAELEALDHEVRMCLVGLDGSDDVPAVVTAALHEGPWDCVDVGGGLRHGDELELFEEVVDLVHRLAPQATIAFNRTPDDLAEAVLRGLARRRTAAP
jgi:hypothetical protein